MRTPRTNRFWRTVYTLRYHTPIQLLRRLQSRTRATRAKNSKLSAPSANVPIAEAVQIDESKAGVFRQLLTGRIAARRESVKNRRNDILEGRLGLIGCTAELGWPLDWKSSAQLDVDHLWQFHLQYHEFLLDLAEYARIHANAANRDSESISPSSTVAVKEFADVETTQAISQIIESWIDAYPNAGGDAWHPFCISRRLPVWCMVWHAFPANELKKQLALSIHRQATYLHQHLEFDPGGNHLLENLRALVFAACFIVDDENQTPQTLTWLDTAEQIFRRELPRQILPSGEHFERTPAYHGVVLELLIEVRDVLQSVRPDFSQYLGEYIERMSTIAKGIGHPDGEMPLFADSTFASMPVTAALLKRSKPTTAASSVNDVAADLVHDDNDRHHAAAIGDYWVWRSPDATVVFDAGDAAADHLPAHGHCDLLNLEVSVNGQRLIVDGGVFDYGDTEMRKYCRGTAAHNVLQIDGIDQCDVWSRFRMGYRGHTGSLRSGVNDSFSWATASHNAYSRVSVPTVGRWLGCGHCNGSQQIICVDWAVGHGQHQFANRVRLHPAVDVQSTGPGEYQLTLGNHTWELRWSRLNAGGQTTVEDGWYCPDFGSREPISVVVDKLNGSLPYASAWILQQSVPGECYSAPTLTLNDENELQLSVGGTTHRIAC